MRRPSANREVTAEHGEKMIEVKVRFWTDGIAQTEGKVRPKHAWASGVVRMERNRAHGITPKSPVIFHTLLDMTASIEKTLIKHGIQLLPPRKMKKYFTDGTSD